MTNTPQKPEFDQYAKSYTDLVRDSIRASGEEPSYFSAQKARYMAAWLGPHVSTSKLEVLDFGCGIGNSIPHLRDAFPAARLHGVDPSNESIRLASRAHAYAIFSTDTDEIIPYPEHSFDLVQVACVFHHISLEHRLHWMKEIRRVLKPGGHVFVFEHNMLNPLTVNSVRNSPIDVDAILLPRRELMNLARGAAFNQIRARYIVFFPKILAHLRPMESFMGWIPFGAQYVVHATS